MHLCGVAFHRQEIPKNQVTILLCRLHPFMKVQGMYIAVPDSLGGMEDLKQRMSERRELHSGQFKI